MIATHLHGRRRPFGLLFLVLLPFLTVHVLPADASQDPEFAKQWGLAKIEAESAWARATGEGIVIAVIDTGVDLGHEDLASKLLPGVDYYDGGTPQDRNGHGTHVAGIAAALTGNGRGVAGTAPGAKILPMRVLGPDGTCSPCSTPEAIDESVARGADVINLSLSSLGKAVLGPYQAFADALDRAWAAGVIPVLAAGNEYVLESGYEDNPAIVVSATDRNDTKPDFSSGVGAAKWAIAAPGGGNTLDPRAADIYSTYWHREIPNHYAYNSGTSMSAPFVSGAAAVLLSMGLTPQQTVDRLLQTATDIGPPGRDSTFGAGRLNLGAAVASVPTSGGQGGGSGGGGGVPPRRQGSSRGSTAIAASPSAVASPSPTGASPTPQDEPETEAGARPGDGPPQRDASSPAGLLVGLAALAAAGGGAGLWFYLYQRKVSGKLGKA